MRNFKKKESFSLLSFEYLFAALCAGFCSSGFVTLVTAEGNYKELAFAAGVKLYMVLAVTAVVFLLCIFGVIYTGKKSIIPAALLVTAVLFSCALSYKGSYLWEENEKNIFMNFGIAFVMFLIVSWVGKEDKLELEGVKLPKHTEWALAGILFVGFTALVSAVSIARYKGYFASNFDFGIFAQMFENMRTTGKPVTTVERNALMSHFGVHFSPFYYLLLPFYALCPRPETLLVIQAAFVAVGVFPVVLLCKKLELTRSVTLCCIFIYIFFPSLADGCLCDFHENKFLTVLILWALYFVSSRKRMGILTFGILILTVKEDAAIYVMAIALYLFVCRKDYLTGGGLLVGAALYFVLAGAVVAKLGDGVMMWRLGNFIPEGQNGFAAVVRTCLVNFGYFLSQILTWEKIRFLIWMLLPVAFAPFFHEEKSVFLLLLPMAAINLMPDWQYQYNINYQYTFGAAGLCIFLLLITLARMPLLQRRKLVLFSVSMCMVMSASLFFPRSRAMLDMEAANREKAAEYNKMIASLSEDMEITADGFFIPHMYRFKKVYQYPNHYGESVKTEYLLVNQDSVRENKDGLADFMGDDYELVSESGLMCLYQRKDA